MVSRRPADRRVYSPPGIGLTLSWSWSAAAAAEVSRGYHLQVRQGILGYIVTAHGGTAESAGIGHSPPPELLFPVTFTVWG